MMAFFLKNILEGCGVFSKKGNSVGYRLRKSVAKITHFSKPNFWFFTKNFRKWRGVGLKMLVLWWDLFAPHRAIQQNKPQVTNYYSSRDIRPTLTVPFNLKWIVQLYKRIFDKNLLLSLNPDDQFDRWQIINKTQLDIRLKRTWIHTNRSEKKSRKYWSWVFCWCVPNLDIDY